MNRRTKGFLVGAIVGTLPTAYLLAWGSVVALHCAQWIDAPRFVFLATTIFRPIHWYIENQYLGSEELGQFYYDICQMGWRIRQ